LLLLLLLRLLLLLLLRLLLLLLLRLHGCNLYLVLHHLCLTINR
jgi:hypothetical protein